jgi:hypothetical protein
VSPPTRVKHRSARPITAAAPNRPPESLLFCITISSTKKLYKQVNACINQEKRENKKLYENKNGEKTETASAAQGVYDLVDGGVIHYGIRNYRIPGKEEEKKPLNDHRLKAVGFVAAESRVEAKAS